MDLAFELARALSAAAFLGYGAACVVSRHMVAEFERYGLARYRVLVGWLELFGGLGLLVSIGWPAVTPLAAGGLTLLMAAGVATRLRVRDPLPSLLPALGLGLVNAFVLASSIGPIGALD